MDYRKKRGSFETVMIIIIVVLLVLIAITSALLLLRPLIRDRGSKLAVERRLSLGKRYLSEMEYDKAVAEFSEVVRIDKKNTEAYVGLGDAYTGLGKWSSAVENYDTALVTVRGKVGVASADQPHNQHQDGGTPSAWQETGLTREDVLTMANLPDNEYMTDDDLYLIAVVVDPEEYGVQNQSGPFKADKVELTADEIYDIIVRRNDAIEYDLVDIRARGEDESKYRDYIDWVNGHEINSDGLTDNDSSEEVPAAEEETPQVDWYAYIRENYVEDMGYASLETRSNTVNSQQLEPWDERTGVLSVQIEDLNDDGIDECAVYYLDQNLLYLALLSADENGEVVEKANRELGGIYDTGFGDNIGGIITADGKKYIYVESYSNAYFANGYGAMCYFYAYDGQDFRLEIVVGKTEGGSMGFVYSIDRYDENGKFPKYTPDDYNGEHFTRTILCTDGYINETGDMSDYDTSIMVDDYVPEKSMSTGMEMITGVTPDIVTLENADCGYAFGNDFPTYRNSDIFTQAYHYNANGSGNYESRNITVTVEDFTNAQQMIESGE